MNFTYLSKMENAKLAFGEFPGEGLILKLAQALDADTDELLLLAEKVPARIKKRVLERPDAFRKLAALDDKTLDLVLAEGDHLSGEGKGHRIKERQARS
jgi:HTH-type transcriptional regulator, competence development regulator